MTVYYDSIQQIFDIVADHLLTQNAKCMVGSDCAYRNERGMKCAVGALIPDEMYNPDWEGNGPGDLLAGCIDTEFQTIFSVDLVESDEAELVELLEELQSIHDVVGVVEWPVALVLLAKTLQLEYDHPKLLEVSAP